MRPPLATRQEVEADRKAAKIEARARRKQEKELEKQRKVDAQREVLSSIDRLGWWWPGE